MIALILPKISYFAISPIIALASTAVLILVIKSLSAKELPVSLWSLLGVLGSLAAIGFEAYNLVNVNSNKAYPAVDFSIVIDGFSAVLGIAICFGALIFSLIAPIFSKLSKWSGAEVIVLGLLSSLGAVLMVDAGDLIIVFLGLEIMSISLYVLSGSDLRKSKSSEAALKYLILGGISSAVFVYGIALEYGATGTTNIASMATFLANNVLNKNGLLLLAMIFLLSGFFFKVSLVPFHVWTPDVYEGAPSPAVTFMASVAKIGGFGALIRVFVSGLHTYSSYYEPIIFAVAILSLVVGAFGGLIQTNVKRIMAYSAINHSGFILLGIYLLTKNSISGSVVYLIGYSIFTMGSFSVISMVGSLTEEDHSISAYRGLYKKSPFLAGCLTLFLLAQAGIPLTVGFVAKFSVLAGLLSSANAYAVALGVVAMVTSVVSAFYYLRIVINLYSLPDLAPVESVVQIQSSPIETSTIVKLQKTLEAKLAGASLVILAIFTVLLGVLPSLIIDLANHAVLAF